MPVTPNHTIPPEKIAPGLVLNGAIRLEERLGEGGMGAVFRGEQLRLQRAVAVKMLHPEIARDPIVFSRFQREAQLCATLGNQHIVDVYDFNISEGGYPYIVMELLEGHDLGEELEEVDALEARTWVPLLLQVCRGLEAAHDAEIIHRDLKPSNLFICHDERGAPLVKLVDFGISKARNSSDTLTKTGDLFGTPYYMAPEMALAQPHEIDTRTDLYALGAISYEVLSGRHPFEALSIPTLLYQIVHETCPPLVGKRAPIPDDLHAIVMTLLAKKRTTGSGASASSATASRRSAGPPRTASPPSLPSRRPIAPTPPPSQRQPISRRRSTSPTAKELMPPRSRPVSSRRPLPKAPRART